MVEFEVVAAGEENVPDIFRLAERGGLSSWTEADYQAEVHRDDSIFLVIKEKSAERSEGFIAARLIMSTDSSYPSEAEILNITVAPEYREKGLGSALLRTAVAKIIRHSPATIWLDVRQSNRSAVAFYENNGFTTVYSRKNFYSDPTEDAFVMKMVV